MSCVLLQPFISFLDTDIYDSSAWSHTSKLHQLPYVSFFKMLQPENCRCVCLPSRFLYYVF